MNGVALDLFHDTLGIKYIYIYVSNYLQVIYQDILRHTLNTQDYLKHTSLDQSYYGNVYRCCFPPSFFVAFHRKKGCTLQILTCIESMNHRNFSSPEAIL